MLSPTSREVLFAYPPSPPWNLPSFTVESPLSSHALAHLDFLPSHDVVIWTDGSAPLPLGKSGSGVLTNCSLLRPLFPFWQAHSVLLSIFPFTSNSLAYLAGTVFSLLRLKWVPGHSFLPGDDAADEVARQGALLVPSQIVFEPSLAASLLLSLVSTLFFFRIGGLPSYLNSLILRIPRFPLRNCALSSRLLCPLSSLLQRTQPTVTLISH